MGIYLVTGGAGFIGSHMATALVERGDRVRVLDNLSTGHRENLAHLGNRVELINGDLVDRGAMVAALEGVEVVFHQAALASVPRSVERPGYECGVRHWHGDAARCGSAVRRAARSIRRLQQCLRRPADRREA